MCASAQAHTHSLANNMFFPIAGFLKGGGLDLSPFQLWRDELATWKIPPAGYDSWVKSLLGEMFLDST